MDIIEISKEHLGGAMEVLIEAYNIHVNGKEYLGYVQKGDVISVKLRIMSKKKVNNIIIGYIKKKRPDNRPGVIIYRVLNFCSIN